jgi:hypothetical protein
MHENVETTLVCHARVPLVSAPVESRIEQLRSLADTTLVDGVVVRSWPDSVRLDGERDHVALARFEQFQSWARRRRVSIQPPFETRTRSSVLEDDGVEVLVTPVLCLSVYRDEQLVGVFPHTNDGETYTIEQAIDRLQDGDLPRPLGGVPSETTVEPQHCPDCGGRLMNGQGVFICRNCAWTGALSPDGWERLPSGGRSGKEAVSD